MSRPQHTRSDVRPWRPVLLVWGLCALLPGEEPAAEPQPSLPPEPRTLHLAPGTVGTAGHTIDRQALAGDIEALTVTVKRVEATLAAAGSPEPEAGEEHAPRPPPEAGSKPREAEHFGAGLVVTGTGEGALVDARIDSQPVEAILTDLVRLAELPLEQTRLPGLRRPASLHIDRLPVAEALDRLLGQVGMAWRGEGEGATRRLMLTTTPGGADDEQAAVRALERARDAAAAADDAAAEGEARWLLARRLLDRDQPAEAMRGFNALVQAISRSKDKDARRWMQKAVRGIGDCMVRLRQWSDARSVYRNYIGRADDADPDLPAVYLASAEAGRQRGRDTRDPLAFDEAIEDLHALLEKFGDDRHRAEVPAARLLIGGLLFDAGRWGEAETQLRRYADEAGGHTTDTITFQLAECAFQVGRIDEARTGFEELFRRWRAGSDAPPKELAEQAAYRIGLCHLREARPRFVHALFAFQRAQAEFPKSKLTPELLLNIARCYAEIEREDEAVAALWEMLKQDGVSSGDAQARLDQQLGGLLGRLSEYPGPIRAKVMFYIAQAEHRRAERDRASRAVVAAQAVGYYERVLSEDPSPELKDAARLGLARACFLAGNDDRGVLELANALKDPGLGDRDRAYAARLLGDHYRALGRPRDAVKAYQGVFE